MKKPSMILPVFLILCYMVGCQDKEANVERITEDGVEVVINHLEPYKVKGEPITLHIEEEFTIDTEKDEIAEIGVTDIRGFDIDSQGNIYFFQEQEYDENLVYKFDEEGNFLTKFGKRGQGPGEIQYPKFAYITEKDEILLQDYSSTRLYIFDGNGTLTKEISLGSKSGSSLVFYPLENSNYVSFGQEIDMTARRLYSIIRLYNTKFEILKELDMCDYGPIWTDAPKIKCTPRVFICILSNGMIYVGHENRGYEILIYDFEGNLLKKIRKEYNPADVPDEFKEYWISNMGRFKDRLYFTNSMSPFHYFFLDDERRLYVKTYENGNRPSEYMHDIFSSEGIFIKRKSLPGYGKWIYPELELNRAKAKNKRFYCIREKESGYKELVVYGMKWE